MECYRCGAKVTPDRFDLEGWVALHAWDDGTALFVCPGCQSEREARLVARVDLYSRGLTWPH